MIRVIIIKELPGKEPVPLGEMRIVNQSPAGELGDYEVEVGIEHGNSVSVLSRRISPFLRKKQNVFALIYDVLDELEPEHFRLDRDPDDPHPGHSVNQRALLKAFRKVLK